jgi:hypothetical protein
MNEQEWRDELATYTTPEQTAKEILEGVADHLDAECTSGHTQVVATQGSQPRVPFVQTAISCDRGTPGCHLIHQDLVALRFARIGLEHLVGQM